MFRLVYRDRFCRDCGERNQWPICECGYMRPLSDEFSVIERHVRRYRWTPAGAVPRIPFGPFELAQIRDAIIERGRGVEEDQTTGDDALPEVFAHVGDAAAGENDLLETVILVLTWPGHAAIAHGD